MTFKPGDIVCYSGNSVWEYIVKSTVPFTVITYLPINRADRDLYANIGNSFIVSSIAKISFLRKSTKLERIIHGI